MRPMFHAKVPSADIGALNLHEYFSPLSTGLTSRPHTGQLTATEESADHSRSGTPPPLTLHEYRPFSTGLTSCHYSNQLTATEEFVDHSGSLISVPPPHHHPSIAISQQIGCYSPTRGRGGGEGGGVNPSPSYLRMSAHCCNFWPKCLCLRLNSGNLLGDDEVVLNKPQAIRFQFLLCFELRDARHTACLWPQDVLALNYCLPQVLLILNWAPSRWDFSSAPPLHAALFRHADIWQLSPPKNA